MPNPNGSVVKKVLPVIYVIDTSGSMRGARIASVNEAIHELEPVLHEKMNELADAEIKLAVSDKIRSMECGGMLRHLSEVYDNALAVYEAAEEDYRRLDERYTRMDEKVAAHEQEAPLSDDAPEEYRDFLGKLRFSDSLLAPIKQELNKVRQEREAANEKWQAAAKAMETARDSYFPRKEIYDSLVKQKEELVAALEQLQADDGAGEQ